MDTILKVQAILKQFGKLNAVDRLSFDINKGEIFALLGPNGAGKTTTVRMLMGIIKPDVGSIEYFLQPGNSPTNPLPSQLGYLPEERGLYQDIPVIRTLEYMGIIRRMNKYDARKAAEFWLDKLELSDRKNEKLSTLSKGNQQKIQFISSILHRPDFAVLDEPFSGFDPVNQETFMMIIKELRSEGTTILLSAHQMHLVEKVADRVLLLSKGKSIASGTVNEIKKEYSAGNILIINFDETPDISFFNHDDAVEKAELINSNEIRIYLKQNKSLSGLLSKAASDYTITSVRTEQISLHEIFIDKINKDRENNDEQ